jgi:regulatory protein
VDEKKKVKFTPSQALLKAANFCAYQERSHHEVTQRLAEWGIYGIDAQEILLQLIEQNYLNEERFAIAFAGGKFRVKQWGRVKIKQELKMHKVSDYCINKALQEIDEEVYLATLQDEIDKKWQQTKDANVLSKRAKVARYLIGRGFEQELIWNELKRLS